MKYTDSALQRLTKAELIETIKLLKKNCEELEEVNDRQYKMLEEKDKYGWHDLRKDPNDLPKNFYDYLPCIIARKIGDEIVTEYCEYSFIDNFGYYFIGVPQDEVIAWKEIAPFEVDV